MSTKRSSDQVRVWAVEQKSTYSRAQVETGADVEAWFHYRGAEQAMDCLIKWLDNGMDSEEKMINNIKQAFALFKQAQDLLNSGPAAYYLDTLLSAYDLLMSRYAPFQVGDHVQLAITPEITEIVNPGWYGYKDALVAGASGVVTSAECRAGRFVFSVRFVGCDGVFSFGENDLRLDSEVQS